MKKYLFLFYSSVLLLQTGCTPEGPVGPKGPDGTLYPEEGYIAYTLTGTRRDGTAFAEKDSLTGVSILSAVRTILNTRSAVATRYRPNDAFVYASFSVVGDTAFSSISNGGLDIVFTKVLADNSLFYFQTYAAMTPTATQDQLAFSNIVWDRAKGRFTGNFTAIGSTNSSGNQATVSGHFDVAVQEIVNRP